MLNIFNIHKFLLCQFVFNNRTDNLSGAQHEYNTRFRHDILPTDRRLNLSRRSPLFNGVLLFNGIPDDIRAASSPFAFKRKLRNYLVNSVQVEGNQ